MFQLLLFLGLLASVITAIVVAYFPGRRNVERVFTRDGLRAARTFVGLPSSPAALLLLQAVSISAFLFALNAVPDGSLRSSLLLVAGASCGLSWLFARALFNRDPIPVATWCWAVVGIIYVTHGLIDLLQLLPSVFAPDGAAIRVAGNINMLASSTVLLLALIEPLRGDFSVLENREQRFRLCFTGVYAFLMGTGVLWLQGSGESVANADQVQSVCAVLALFGSAIALLYRHRHPQETPARSRPARQASTYSAEEKALAVDIQTLISEQEFFLLPQIKVEDVASQLQVPEYKVTRAVTGPLGMRNFNQLLNAHRIRYAKSLLADTEQVRESILNIALASGFNSLGPFNREFKAREGMTPSQFRREVLSMSQSTGLSQL